MWNVPVQSSGNDKRTMIVDGQEMVNFPGSSLKETWRGAIGCLMV